MTKNEALKLALMYVESNCPALVHQAIVKALAQPAQEPDELTIAYMSGLYDGKKAERADLIKFFENHWRSDWSDGQIIETLEARWNT